MHTRKIYSLLLLLLLFASCQRGKKASTFGASGTPLSLLVVLPDSLYTKPLKDSIYASFRTPVMVLPQIEPMQDVSFTTESQFTPVFKSMRNIFYVTVDPNHYTRPAVSIVRDKFATGQIIIHAKAESKASVYKLLKVRGEELSRLIYKEEIRRWVAPLEFTYSKKATTLMEESLQVTGNIPNELEYLNKGKDFIWASNMDQKRRLDFVVYTFPYREANTFTLDYLIHKRDSVLRINITGAHPNSYITTEKRVPSIYRTFTHNGAFRAEVRGLWAMENDMMGGPFVMHAFLDETMKRVIVAEAFVYAPGEKKRNLMLFNEATLYTIRPIGIPFKYTPSDKETAQKDSVISVAK